MKITEAKIHEIDRKWVGIENKKTIKKIGKKFKYKGFISPLFGYIYVDKEYGLSLRIVGNIERDGKNKLYINEDFLNDELDMSYELMTKLDLDITILSEDVVNHIEGSKIVENKLEDNYKNINNFLSTRELEYLDPFRDKKYPDDIEIIYTDKETEETENLWVTIEGIHDRYPELLICRLDDNSNLKPNLVEGDYVAVKYDEETDTCIFVSELKRREKEPEE